jgi:DNA helicase HerA-like ATPase
MADEGLFIGTGGGARQVINWKRANRHGLIAGATGTGKTITLQVMAEGFSRNGVPVFVSDVKGDLSGMAMAGNAAQKNHDIFAARATEIGDSEWVYSDNPVQFWDLFGEGGHPVRTTVSEMGPLMLSRLMDLNEVQEGVLTIAFHVADKEGLLLLDLDDLQLMLANIAERADELTITYGNVSKQSVGTIQRSLLQLRSQGGDHFFGEPALDLDDFIANDDKGRGIINILAAEKLMQSPKLYSTFLLWLLSELFETLPEIGDPEKPRLVFFFDEAHLLFNDAPKALVEKIEQVVRLIRSKGVGVYFITQNPIDIPDTVAGQLNNRVQHKLNAFTPRDQAAVKAAAETFRANPDVDVVTAITELKVGEALVSVLQADGSPTPVERTLIKPPASRTGPLTPQERGVMITTDAVGDKYDDPIDRESAEEILLAKAGQAAAAAAASEAAEEQAKLDAIAAKEKAKADAAAAKEAARIAAREAREAAKPSIADKMLQSAARSAASSIGRQLSGSLGKSLVRGLLGGLFK